MAEDTQDVTVQEEVDIIPIGEEHKDDVDHDSASDTDNTMDVDGAVLIDGHAEPNGDEDAKVAALNNRGVKNRKKKDPLSFDSLMREHDAMLIIRSVLIMVVALILLIPMPVTFLAVKFLIFIFLAYSSIYNEIMIGEEAAIRQDKHSKRAHIVSYVAVGVTAVLFCWSALRAGMDVSSMQAALNDAQARLTAAGLPNIIVHH